MHSYAHWTLETASYINISLFEHLGLILAFVVVVLTPKKDSFLHMEGGYPAEH